MRPGYKPLLHLFLVVLLGFFAYSNTFDVPFQFDDQINIVESPIVRDLGRLGDPDSLNAPHMKMAARNRPVGYLTFAFNYSLHGLDVTGYHIFNLAVHLVNAILVYLFFVCMFRTPLLEASALKSNPRHVALFAALLFVSHPVQTQAVTYIVQRLASLATMFYLLTLVAYLKYRLSERRGHQYSFYALSLIAAVLAMKTKEIAFTLPIMAAICEFMFFSDTVKRRLLRLLPLLLTMLVIPATILASGIASGEAIGGLGEVARLQTSMPRLEYLFTEFRGIVTYLRLLVLPVNQVLDYGYPVFASFADPEVYLSFLFLLSIAAMGIYLLVRSRRAEPALRMVSLGIFWFFVTLSVESSFIPIRDVIFEHRLYLPSVGFFVSVVAAVFAFVRQDRARKAVSALLVGVCLVLAVATYERNTVWQSEIRLWEDTVSKTPGNPRARYELGVSYDLAGMTDKAIEEYKTALRLYPEYVYAHINLGIAQSEKGRLDKAIEHFLIASRLSPNLDYVHINLGITYSRLGRFDKAAEHYRQALRLNPGNGKARMLLGSISDVEE